MTNKYYFIKFTYTFFNEIVDLVKFIFVKQKTLVIDEGQFLDATLEAAALEETQQTDAEDSIDLFPVATIVPFLKLPVLSDEFAFDFAYDPSKAFYDLDHCCPN